MKKQTNLSLITAALALALSGCALEGTTSSVGEAQQNVLSAGGLDAQLVTHSVWNEGWCGAVILTNQHASATVNDWTVTLDLGGTTLDSSWSANFSGSSGVVTVTPVHWTREIAPSQNKQFGFCASRSSNSVPLPSIVSVEDDLPGGGTCVPSAVTPASGRVEALVSNVDDFVYITVNGLRAKTWNYGGPDQGTLVDVSRFFTSGTNEVRVQAMNTGGPTAYEIEIFVDGLSVFQASEPVQSAPEGILFDQTITVPLSGVPASQLVSLTSAAPGKVYVNGQYTGETTPATLRLPPGTFEIGLGQSSDVYGAYTGQYFEQEVTVQDCPLEVELDEDAPLPVQNQTRVAILPIRETYHGSSSDVGWLKDSDIAPFVAQAEATNDAWVKPFSYGLTEWDITLLPIVEGVPLLRNADAGDAPQTDPFLTSAGLQSLRGQYDIIIFYYSTHRANDTRVANLPCCIWAGGQDISYDTGWVRGSTLGTPSEGLYHESLHSYEWYNGWRQRAYNGVGGLHGAEEHGYVYNQNGEADWLAFYRDFARNLVVETNDMRNGVSYPYIPTTGDLFVGVFDTMRYGTQDTRPAARRAQELRALSQSAKILPLACQP